jgi:hypothetical protein
MPALSAQVALAILCAVALVACLVALFAGQPRGAGRKTSTQTALDLFWAIAPFGFLGLLIYLAIREAQR